MIARLFRSRKPAGTGKPMRPQVAVNATVPAGVRVYAIGDIHGRIDLLRRLEDQIAGHAAGNPMPHNILIYIGDYVDRGYESRAVIEHLIAPTLPGFERVILKGNHEEFVLRFLDGDDVAAIWLVNGGRETLMSYGVMMPPGIDREEQVEEARTKFREAFPPAHKDFLDSLALTHNVGGYLFVHAGIRPGVALEAQDPADLLWIREAFLNSTAAHGAVIVHGHTPVGEPEVENNRIGIDTGAFATGHLTCVVLDGAGHSFLAT